MVSGGVTFHFPSYPELLVAAAASRLLCSMPDSIMCSFILPPGTTRIVDSETGAGGVDQWMSQGR